MELRLLHREDLPIRVEWMNSPLVYSSMHYDIPITLEGTMKWFENNEGNDSRVDVVIIDEGEIVAFAGITNIDKGLKKGESYTFVCPHLQGKGIGTQARKIVLDYAFYELGLNKIYAYTNEDNIPSCKISEKLGFKLEGRFRQEYKTKNGVLKDRLYYGLLREDWINSKFNHENI